MTIRLLLGFLLLSIPSRLAIGQDQTNVERVHRITKAEYEATLEYWEEKFAEILTVQVVGQSAAGDDIHLVKISDPTVEDADKQVALVTALHGGPERSGTSTALHFIEWMTSDAPAAREIRQKQILIIMPINNPQAFFQTDRFGNAANIDPYTGGGPQHWDLKTLNYLSADKAPEVKAVLDVVDQWQPEVHADLHGTGLQEFPLEKLGDRTRYQGQTMVEITGSAYSNYALRPWDWRVTEAIISAGENEGYPSDRFEADAQRSFHGPVMNPISDRTWSGQSNFYTAQYGYAKYHTMVSAFEIGWEQSGVARLRGLLEIGNKPWQGEPYSGYPVNRVKSYVGHFVTAYGNNAAERRKSRTELWQNQGQFGQAILYPQTDGRDTYFVTTSSDAAERLVKDLDQFLAGISKRSDVDFDSLQQFIRRGPEMQLAVSPPRKTTKADYQNKTGLGFRLRLPYRNPTIDSLQLNGHVLKQDPKNGWNSWFANGYTQVQVNLPPSETEGQDLFLITCEYTPDQVRKIGWEPPAEVTAKLRSK